MLKKLRRKTALKSTIFFGLLTAGLYTAVFSNAPLIMKYFTKGGLYAVLPVGTAFIFSFVHGAFTGSFWTACGIEPSKRITAIAEKYKTTRRGRRPRLYAHLEMK